MSTLDPVQLAALDFARDKRGVGWFMEQGLGKTLCALAEFSWYQNLDEADRMVVIAPNTFKKGWFDEVEKHGFNFNFHIYQSSRRASAEQFPAPPGAQRAAGPGAELRGDPLARRLDGGRNLGAGRADLSLD